VCLEVEGILGGRTLKCRMQSEKCKIKGKLGDRSCEVHFAMQVVVRAPPHCV